MILAFDTSTAACSAALFDSDGRLLDSRLEVIGRGHAERLAPLLDDLLDGRAPARIMVGVGPGSFTGIRVGLATAHGLAIGWGCDLVGFSSLALIAAALPGDEPVAAAIAGGHGEIFVQSFGGRPSDGTPRVASAPPVNLTPDRAAAATSATLVAGPAAALLIAARGWGDAVESLPDAANALAVDLASGTLDPVPLYLRAPDAKVKSAA